MRNSNSVKVSMVYSVWVDRCISNEVEFLNNICGVQTLFSCCGHGDGGYIVVHPDHIDDMKSLGYESDGKLYATRFDHEDVEFLTGHLWLLRFLPKSECKCVMNWIFRWF